MFISLLFVFNVENKNDIMFWSFVVGNIIYYVVGIILAFVLAKIKTKKVVALYARRKVKNKNR